MMWIPSFRPLTGISLFLCKRDTETATQDKQFSSPHGDFSFSIEVTSLCPADRVRFRPLTGISLFLFIPRCDKEGWAMFSSPHGDFSFSMIPFCFSFDFVHQVFVPSRGFLFFYPISYSPYKSRAIFIICGANIFKPSECYF